MQLAQDPSTSPHGAPPSSGGVAVIGSLNIDVVYTVDAIPLPGETVSGKFEALHLGGKGLNQAVAAARVGADVTLLGCVGADGYGDRIRDGLDQENINAEHVTTHASASTGTAVVVVDTRAENAIVVDAGANQKLGVNHVLAASGQIASAAVVLTQFEIPAAATEQAALAANGTVIVNPAPARPISDLLVERTDILVPNRAELARITDSAEPSNAGEVARLVRTLPAHLTVIVTLGKDGVFVRADGETALVSAVPTTAVNTTGAGDCFCGTLAARLAAGASLDHAVQFAIHAAAISVTRQGAAAAMPSAVDVKHAMEQPHY